MMQRTSKVFALAGALACGLSAPVWGAQVPDNHEQQLEQQVQRLQARVAELEQQGRQRLDDPATGRGSQGPGP